MTFQEILEYQEKRRPELWRICYPRLYRNIENYGSPRLGAVMYMRSVAWLLDHITDVPYSVRNIYMAASLARQYDFPCFFVSPELFISIANTDVTSFCARLYGQRRAKGKTERLIAELQKSE